MILLTVKAIASPVAAAPAIGRAAFFRELFGRRAARLVAERAAVAGKAEVLSDQDVIELCALAEHPAHVRAASGVK